MRTIPIILVLTISILAPQPSRAEVLYPWCAQYARDGRNCGFSTYEQCRATVSGTGGYCLENPLYRPGAEGAPYGRRARRY